MDIVLKNAQLVLRDEVVTGSVRISGGTVVSVDSGPCNVTNAMDLGGDYLLPGFVELHTDNLEQELEPRPGVFWPDPIASVLAHDNTMAGAGITTVLDAVSLGEYHDGPSRSKIMDLSIQALNRARATGVLRADHRLHLRCEFSDPKVVDMLLPHIDDPALMLVSLMDHTPGQRQFTDTDKYRKYYKKGWSDAEFAELSRRMVATQEACAADNRCRIIELCRERSLPMASHDDTTPEHVAQAVGRGDRHLRVSDHPRGRAARPAGGHPHRHGRPQPGARGVSLRQRLGPRAGRGGAPRRALLGLRAGQPGVRGVHPAPHPRRIPGRGRGQDQPEPGAGRGADRPGRDSARQARGPGPGAGDRRRARRVTDLVRGMFRKCPK